MGTIGTQSNETITADRRTDYIAGMAGDDILDSGRQDDELAMLGGSGNDTYILRDDTEALIADTGGYDTIVLPITAARLERAIARGDRDDFAVIDGKHYFIDADDAEFLIADFQGQGKIENFVTSDNVTFSFDWLWAATKDRVQHLSSAYIDRSDRVLLDQALSWRDTLRDAEQTPSPGIPSSPSAPSVPDPVQPNPATDVLVGTAGNDALRAGYGIRCVAGMAGDDALYSGRYEDLAMLGGSGNDAYTLRYDAEVLIADAGGADTIVLPVTAARLERYIARAERDDFAVIDGKHYYIDIDAAECLIVDFQGQGKIENIVTSDNVVLSFEQLWAATQDRVQYLSWSQIGRSDRALFDQTVSWRDTLLNEEQTGLPSTTPPPVIDNAPLWFNDNVYLENKEAQCGLSGAPLVTALETAGFLGKDGDFRHFSQFGQWEDVSPITTFDADYYYRSKAADSNNINISQVTAAQAQSMENAIRNAGMNAWNHYQYFGTREGIDGNANFDTSAYMEAKLAQMNQGSLLQRSASGYTMEQLYDAFAAAGLSAAAHYEAYGKAEGLTAVGVTTAYAAMDIQGSE